MALIDCPAPGCDVQLEEDDLLAQINHVDRCHPELAAQRLRDDEAPYDPATGRRVSTWVSDG